MDLIYLSLACSALSLTLTKTHLAEWIRQHCLGWRTIYNLFDCHYCMSHWISFGLVYVYRPIPVASGSPLLDFLVTVFIIIGMAAIPSSFIIMFMRKAK